ncbi:MAG: hypothetical protein JW746_01265 [Candidatus Krumholzibacteriota bacterium]|nr:hypothetical protein [Candidatus Krumholzibacteriota bacterium]
MERDSATAIFRNAWMMVGTATIIGVFMLLNWYYYAQVRSGLDREFSTRLRALASMVSASVDSTELAELSGQIDLLGISEIPPDIFKIYSRDFSLSNITILREDGTIILSLHPSLFHPGEIYPLWNMDYPAIIRALEGYPSATGLIRSEEGDYFKAGYSPIPLGSGSTGMVAAVEANAVFLNSLDDLRRSLLVSTSISLAGLLFFVLFVVKASRSLIRTRESLFHSERLASMGRMAAGIAHEIRNPLFIIRSSAEKLRCTCPEIARELDEFIIEETDRLNGILTDYLTFARNETIAPVRCDLVTIIKRSIRLVDEGSSGRTPIKFTCTVEEAPLICEEKKIQQVILNILINAKESGGEDLKIEVSLDISGTDYKICFTDYGAGIERKDISNVFEPFFTTKQTGSGLGLSIARRIIEDHSGSISIESRVGQKTTVTLMLPVPVSLAGE